jgi:tRNA pseudouridine55 synthase
MSARRLTAGVHGVVLLDKPTGMSSNAALQRVRALYGRPKAGHTGTLDPLATGLLPVCLGEATKFSAALLEADKSYEATLRLGYRSSTGDAEGRIESIATPAFTNVQLDEALRALTGRQHQTPPMHSAVKVRGQPLYRLAHRGASIERRPRLVEIRQLALVERGTDSLKLEVTCSKGTYIRVLAEDLGAILGCGAYLTGLRRTAIGRFRIADGIALSALEAMDQAERRAVLLPVDALLHALPRLDLSAEAGMRMRQGVPAAGPADAVPGRVRLYVNSGSFLGVGEIDASGKLIPRRLVAESQETALTP